MATAAARLLDILKTKTILDASPEVVCPWTGCENRDPKRWTIEDRPIETTTDVAYAPMICDVCGRRCVHQQTPPTLADWHRIDKLVRDYLIGWNGAGPMVDSPKASGAEDTDARLRRLRDENLREEFTGVR